MTSSSLTPPLPRGITNNAVHRVANQLHSAAIHLLRSARSVDTKTGLTPQRLSLLSVLVFAGPKTVGELARLEQVSAPAISRIADALENEGLLARRRDGEDRRVVLLTATAKGRKRVEAGRARRVAEVADRLGQLSREELAILERASSVLERLQIER